MSKKGDGLIMSNNQDKKVVKLVISDVVESFRHEEKEQGKNFNYIDRFVFSDKIIEVMDEYDLSYIPNQFIDIFRKARSFRLEIEKYDNDELIAKKDDITNMIEEVLNVREGKYRRRIEEKFFKDFDDFIQNYDGEDRDLWDLFDKHIYDYDIEIVAKLLSWFDGQNSWGAIIMEEEIRDSWNNRFIRYELTKYLYCDDDSYEIIQFGNAVRKNGVIYNAQHFPLDEQLDLEDLFDECYDYYVLCSGIFTRDKDVAISEIVEQYERSNNVKVVKVLQYDALYQKLTETDIKGTLKSNGFEVL